MIPVFKVNYRYRELLKAFFIREKSNFWRGYLITQISALVGSNKIILSSSCRNSIYEILKILPQSKVIIPAYTCEVVVHAAIMANKKIVFAHVSPDSFNVESYPEIDNDSIVIVIHQFGNPSNNIEELIRTCQTKCAPIIEDCAGALGTKINLMHAGTIGDFGVFSFSASKTLQSVTRGGFIIVKDNDNFNLLKGSIVTTKQYSIQFKIKQLVKGILFKSNSYSIFCRIFSTIRKNNTHSDTHKTLSSNTDFSYGREMYEWQAYILSKQFERLSSILAERNFMLSEYQKKLTNPLIKKPDFSIKWNYIRYPILVKQRIKFIAYCREKGIQLGRGYSNPVIPNDYRIEQTINDSIVYLPLGAGYSKNEIQKIIDTVNGFNH